MEEENWYELTDATNAITPSLLVYPERIAQNIKTMISIAGGTANIRPHIKTHKTAEIIKMQLEEGIHKFKCATIAEAELLAMCGASDILLAMQPVGANMKRFLRLMKTYPDSKFSALIDNKSILDDFSELGKKTQTKISLWIDLNNGMNRTGIKPNEDAVLLYKSMALNPQIEARGLHAYDGHIRNSDPIERKKDCDSAFESVLALKTRIEEEGITVDNIVAGGSPSFPFHAQRKGIETSPGTTLLWDAGYGGLFPEMNFLPAAVLITRVISKPSENILCLDLGHKSIAPEMSFPRVDFFKMEGYEQIGQSEEHLVLEGKHNDKHEVGEVNYAIPMHICPTVAKYDSISVVSKGEIIDSWKVAARNQKISI